MNALAQRQRNWLMRLNRVALPPDKVLEVARTVDSSRVLLPEANFAPGPYGHRVVFTSEIVFEYDHKSYLINAELTRKAASFLNVAKIPFILGYTGGKSIHVHVFINPEVNFSEELRPKLERIAQVTGKKPFEVMRNALFKTYFEPVLLGFENDLGLETQKLDEGKLVSNQVIREFGARHESTGFYKTAIAEISGIPRRIGADAVAFPDEIRLWDCPDLLTDVLSKLKVSESKRIVSVQRNRRWSHG